MLDRKARYTIEELKALLNHYIDNNGIILGKIYFKTHLYERNKLLPSTIDSIGRFMNENIWN
ncbi:MAG: hypothetical protein JW822_12120 [Spirochaetales bacterium]|nr:hypothetical protein [Spirochaetales bacterium]